MESGITVNWQPFGDLAARTVVLRAAPINEQLRKGKPHDGYQRKTAAHC